MRQKERWAAREETRRFAQRAWLDNHACCRRVVPKICVTDLFCLQKLFGGLMFSRDTVGEAAKRCPNEPCSGGRAPRGHASGELPGERRSLFARDPRSRRPQSVRQTASPGATRSRLRPPRFDDTAKPDTGRTGVGLQDSTQPLEAEIKDGMQVRTHLHSGDQAPGCLRPGSDRGDGLDPPPWSAPSSVLAPCPDLRGPAPARSFLEGTPQGFARR